MSRIQSRKAQFLELVAEAAACRQCPAMCERAAVLSEFFPEQRTQLDTMVTEAGLSRMYGGIHYRFDIEAGQALGRNVARFAIAADASGNSVLTAH